jgi:UPF0755 protein
VTGRVLLFAAGATVAVPIAFGAALLVPARVPPDTPLPIAVEIPSGSKTADIATALSRAKVLGSPFLFRVAVRLRGADGRLLAGAYEFPKGHSPLGLVRALETGRFRSNEVTVTVPEGFTRQQIAARLAEAGVVGQAEFLAATETPSAELAAVVPGLPSGATLEGYLFPDTYRFLKRSEPEVVARKFLNNFTAKRAKLPAASGSAQGHTFHDAVILASIVEREVKTGDERRMVADIFWRRLASGIALQADITTAYAVGKTTEKLTPEDLANPSLYNTYQHPGLPPGPIGNPGVVSLNAVLDPKPNDFLYFLTPPGQSAVYAQTLNEHNANKAQYLGR